MPVTRSFKQTFSGGEISPEMFGRIADNKFQQGAALVRNFIVKPQGPAQNRSGFAFVNEVMMLAKALNIDSYEVLEAAKTKWNFLNFQPGLVGGHCIGVDPYYLAEAGKKVNFNKIYPK